MEAHVLSRAARNLVVFSSSISKLSKEDVIDEPGFSVKTNARGFGAKLSRV